ncbi:MAG: DNA topoisomerase 4 subunit A [Lachnospiraceae bacterium]|nr:DNA topoisomerase 4 subunit A [Lachnospiraceae bacterium]
MASKTTAPTKLAELLQIDFSEEMKNSYRDYAVNVIIDRALPDVRDGLKPVQRRILYAMTELNLEPKKPHRKSARIVGDTMGKYHPHGDSSIYDALVHMSEEFSMSIPLIDGHGNFGSIDGDPAAAMRYTEARLSEGAMTMLENLEHNLVEYQPNFDNSEKEPTVLPALLPNLLINGTTGIAVGMTTNIPPHNPGEVIDGVIAYMDNPEITVPELMEYIPGPDFPTGGIITNSDVLPQLYATGEGKIKVRAKTTIENGENGRKNIIVTEIPYTSAGNKQKLVENLVDLMKNKVFEEIYDVRDESSADVRIVIEVRKDRDVENLLNGLFKKSPLEDTYSVNLLAVKEKQPILFNLKSLIKEFVDFQEELYTKEYQNRLMRAKDRMEVVEGLLRATDVIDLIIEILRGSNSVKQAKECLTKGDITDIKFKSEASKKQAMTLDFTERQADAILSMQLSRLIGLEILKLHEESDTIKANIAEYEKILGSMKELHKVIKKQLQEFRKKFGHERRTQITTVEQTNYVVEERIEDIYIIIDKFGYTKAVDATVYNKATSEQLSEYVYTIKMKSNDRLCVFTAEGSMYQVKAQAIPRTKLREKGTLIHQLTKIGKEEVLLYAGFEELFECSFLFATQSGYVKIVSGIEFDTTRTQVNTTKLDPGDKLAGIVKLTATDILSENRKVIMMTSSGLSLGFPLEEVAEFKKTSRGVKGITLEKNDKLALCKVVTPTEENFEFKGKQLSAKKVKMRKRGAKGQKATL